MTTSGFAVPAFIEFAIAQLKDIKITEGGEVGQQLYHAAVQLLPQYELFACRYLSLGPPSSG
jgi:hypothetical protein